MKPVEILALIALMATAGCSSSSTSSVEVQITPDAYRIGNVKSVLATPAVDEAVRQNPRRIMLVTCLSTPPAKVIQFVDEFRARSKALIQGTLTEQGCPA